MSHGRLYENPEKNAIDKESCGIVHAASGGSAQNATGTRDQNLHVTDTRCSAPVPVGSDDVPTAKENPDALAGAAGVDIFGQDYAADYSPELPPEATAFIDTVAALAPADRLSVLELAVDHYRAGQPIPPLFSYMDEANFWADMAARDELKAYLWACWSHLNAADQAAFLGHIERRAAA